MDKGISSFVPDDVLTEILACLPPNSRRRLRLVCQHWRHLVDTRTATNLRNRAKTLVVTQRTAYIIDDLSSTERPRELWTRGSDRGYNGMSMIGTCNSLVCLCCNDSGDIILVNPVTGDTLDIPPLPSRYAGASRNWHRTYTFTYHPTMGRYKIGHVPRYLDRVLVFTLGEESWRVVPMVGRGARFFLDAGIVSADGYTYLAVGGKEARIMSFDLSKENFRSITPPPNILSTPGSWSLTEVHGRLGITFAHVSKRLAETEVWVMEGTAGQLEWNCWYILQIDYYREQLAWPHFAHSGKHVLTQDQNNVLFRRIPNNDTRKARHGVVETSENNRMRMIHNIGPYNNNYKAVATLVYIKTMEPLSVYKCW